MFGLISLARRPISVSDFRKAELDTLRSFTEGATKLEQLEKKRAVTQEEIDSLASRKEEMELLVRKASLSLFLQEERRRHEEVILTAIARDAVLGSAIEKLNRTNEKLTALSEEIATDSNAELLQEVVADAFARGEKYERKKTSTGNPLVDGMIAVSDAFSQAFFGR